MDDPNIANVARLSVIAGPVLGIATDYPDGHLVPPHDHDRGQLMHTLSGAVSVATRAGRWIVPPEHCLWIPAGIEHAVEMIGDVRMRSIYVRQDHAGKLPARLKVMAMRPLLRALIVEAVTLSNTARDPRDRLVRQLLLTEITRLEERPLALPLPATPKMAALCSRFLAAPRLRPSLDAWAEAAGMSRRSFTRHFRRETGLTVDDWRQHALVFAAVPRLARGEAVTSVALDLGYDSVAAFTTMFRRMLGASPRAWLGQRAG